MRIRKRFFKASQRIPCGFSRDSLGILSGFVKNSQRDSLKIFKGFIEDSQEILEGFSKNSFRILEGFLKDFVTDS